MPETRVSWLGDDYLVEMFALALLIIFSSDENNNSNFQETCCQDEHMNFEILNHSFCPSSAHILKGYLIVKHISTGAKLLTCIS